jgi:hypothetical protein
MRLRRVLTGATLALSSALCFAQTTAKPTPYEGVSEPPSTDVIRATEATPVTPPPQPAAAPVTAAPAAQPSRTPAQNADYGIVETPVTTSTGASAQAPVLHTRATDPDFDIVTNVPLPANQLVEGTPIHARLDQELSSRENGRGTLFSAQVVSDVTQNGRVIIPIGSTVHGRVMSADYGRRIAGAASLRLLADEVVLPDGTRYSLRAVVSQTSHGSNTKVNGEGTVLSKDHPRRVAAEYGMGGGSGALVGAGLAGPAGAAVGAGIGLGIVTAHVLLQPNAAVLPAGSNITFGLTQPMQLSPITASAQK